jgi:hypothetical protein
MKILGTVITDSFSWDENCASLIKKVNARMQLLQKVWSFGSNYDEMVHLWKDYCLSILEQSCVVWGGSLTTENVNDLERTQKTFCKLIMEEDYRNYANALSVLGLTTLETRRLKLTIDFARRSISDNKLRDLFPIRQKVHTMETRNREQFKVNHANTNRYSKSAIPTMQRLLNKT